MPWAVQGHLLLNIGLFGEGLTGKFRGRWKNQGGRSERIERHDSILEFDRGKELGQHV